MKALIISFVLLAWKLLLISGYSIGDSSNATRIIGGTHAKKGQFPYAVLMMVTETDNRVSQCGGSIITSRCVLTAAHCVTTERYSSVKSIKIKVGYLDINHKTGGEYEVTAMPKHIKIHPHYNSRDQRNDIATICIDTHFQNTPTSKIIPLAEPNHHGDQHGMAETLGWGETKEDSHVPSPILRFIEIPLLPNEECAEHLGRGFHKDVMLCARGRDKGTCEGDAGGPLVQNGKLVGVNSIRQGCAQHIVPGVYARVSAFLTWIHQNTV